MLAAIHLTLVPSAFFPKGNLRKLMERLLAVFAHPDDETAIGGTLAHYASQGVQVGLVSATKGEAGEISDPTLATPHNLAQVREAELRCACEILGVQDLFLLGYCDSGMQGTPENEKPTAFIRARDEDVQRKLVGLYRSFKPQVVITFEPFGWYGHPDHIAAGKHASAAFDLAGNPEVYPEAGQPWQPVRLFHAAMLRRNFKKMIQTAREMGMDMSDFEDFPFDEPDPMETQITHVLDVTPWGDTKDRAMNCHRTQFGDEHLFRRLPPELFQDMWKFEHFAQVRPAIPQPEKFLPDLFP